jgi:hypothetical protein
MRRLELAAVVKLAHEALCAGLFRKDVNWIPCSLKHMRICSESAQLYF